MVLSTAARGVNAAFGLEYHRALPPTVEMVGPLLPTQVPPLTDDYAAWLEQGPPVVYVNLGTIARPWPGLLERMASAFATDEFRTLWVVPEDIQRRLPTERARSIRIERWVPSQLGVLAHPNVRAFVSHCGVNSVHESIWAGTPVVAIPLFAAQGDMALRVQDAGVGSPLDKHRFTPEQLRNQVREAIRSVAFRTRIDGLQRTFAAAGGTVRAADLIEQAALSNAARGRTS